MGDCSGRFCFTKTFDEELAFQLVSMCVQLKNEILRLHGVGFGCLTSVLFQVSDYLSHGMTILGMIVGASCNGPGVSAMPRQRPSWNPACPVVWQMISPLTYPSRSVSMSVCQRNECQSGPRESCVHTWFTQYLFELMNVMNQM